MRCGASSKYGDRHPQQRSLGHAQILQAPLRAVTSKRRGAPPQRRPSGSNLRASVGAAQKTVAADGSRKRNTFSDPRRRKEMAANDLHETAKALVAEGKGILAADESDSTIKKRFDSIGVESTEETRRAYREMLFTTEGVEEYISGVILFDETVRQSASDGTPFPELLESKRIIPGIKVDTGAKPLALAEGETITEGLDGLRERLAEYRE